MKRVFILLTLCITGLQAYTQVESSVDSKTTKKLTKEQKQEQKRAEEEATAKRVEWMVQQRRFVIEADYLSNQTGNRVMVDRHVNFIKIDSAQIIVQIAPQMGIGGANGLGGVTAVGSITRWEMKKYGKNQQIYSIRLFANTAEGSYDLFLTISPDSSAEATLGGTYPGKLTYYGKLVPIETSRVFKGMSL
jgi:hypothetical protein